jgi:hypothetical protein
MLEDNQKGESAGLGYGPKRIVKYCVLWLRAYDEDKAPSVLQQQSWKRDSDDC